jgi:sulfide:quinone oxidoreductase
VEAGLAKESEQGFVRVDERLRTIGWDDVYAIGDVIWHVVKTGWAAYYEAQVAASNILEDVGIPPAEAPPYLYSEDAIRLTPNVAIRGLRRGGPYTETLSGAEYSAPLPRRLRQNIGGWKL